jgi:hypothetical protein
VSKKTVSAKSVSLSNELTLMMDAIRGVHALTRKFIDSYGMETELPESISALLVVLHERLRFFDRVVQGEVDPRLAWCPQNDAASGFTDGEDFHLTAWSLRKLARHHRAEWKRARRRTETEQRSANERAAAKKDPAP